MSSPEDFVGVFNSTVVICELCTTENTVGIHHTDIQHDQPVMLGICPLCGNFLKPCTRPGVLECGGFWKAQQA